MLSPHPNLTFTLHLAALSKSLNTISLPHSFYVRMNINISLKCKAKVYKFKALSNKNKRAGYLLLSNLRNTQIYFVQL